MVVVVVENKEDWKPTMSHYNQMAFSDLLHINGSSVTQSTPDRAITAAAAKCLSW